jgi:multimeric flavodoxin WrbA
MTDTKTNFRDLKALFINCTIKYDKSQSHTQKLVDKAVEIMEAEGVDVKQVYALEHTIAFGMIKDAKKEVGREDDWPEIQKQIMEADILVLATPIWLGTKSSVATQVVERMYAYSGDQNDKGQYLYYGKTAGCLITGNEDGIKHCAMDMLYAMQHIGYVIPPQADAGWIGEAGPGPSYGDTEWAGKPIGDGKSPMGFNNEFTNRNTTFMAWNLMHMARILKDNKGIPAVGNTAENWKNVTHADSENPEYR